MMILISILLLAVQTCERTVMVSRLPEYVKSKQDIIQILLNINVVPGRHFDFVHYPLGTKSSNRYCFINFKSPNPNVATKAVSYLKAYFGAQISEACHQGFEAC